MRLLLGACGLGIVVSCAPLALISDAVDLLALRVTRGVDMVAMRTIWRRSINANVVKNSDQRRSVVSKVARAEKERVSRFEKANKRVSRQI